MKKIVHVKDQKVFIVDGRIIKESDLSETERNRLLSQSVPQKLIKDVLLTEGHLICG